ncbi:hypothetical protein [Specibacter sp. NPDC078709]|uniref:hypothetical protein n=1 Tax=Specibacter sp. NPDC078709 TaxID=3154364 RepID=UPI00344591D0
MAAAEMMLIHAAKTLLRSMSLARWRFVTGAGSLLENRSPEVAHTAANGMTPRVLVKIRGFGYGFHVSQGVLISLQPGWCLARQGTGLKDSSASPSWLFMWSTLSGTGPWFTVLELSHRFLRRARLEQAI